MLSFIREGDTLVGHSMDRLGRNLDDLRRLVLELTGRGFHVQFLKESLTFTGEDSPMANLLLSVMGAFAQFERDLIRKRQREGIALTKKTRRLCWPETFTHSQSGGGSAPAGGRRESKTILAREFGVTRDTIFRYIGRAKPKVKA
jgi:DNA invertase Pin-like site-specific DNA recombinase